MEQRDSSTAAGTSLSIREKKNQIENLMKKKMVDDVMKKCVNTVLAGW